MDWLASLYNMSSRATSTLKNVSLATAAGSATSDDNGEDVVASSSQQEQSLPAYLRRPIDPDRMKLTEEERQWALELKDTVENYPDLDELTDFMYAQIVLAEKGDIDKAVDRAYALQGFRQDYDILDNFPQAKRILGRNLRRHSGMALDFYFGENGAFVHGVSSGDRYVIVGDWTKIDITSFADPEEKKAMIAGAYYIQHCYNPDLEAVRKGALFLFECEGFMWKAPKMLNFDIFRLIFEGVLGLYPLNAYKMMFFHTGVVMNTLLSMLRKYVPASLHKTFVVGCQAPTRLDKFCLLPSPKVATEKILRDMTECLRRRYEAEANFKLD